MQRALDVWHMMAVAGCVVWGATMARMVLYACCEGPARQPPVCWWVGCGRDRDDVGRGGRPVLCGAEHGRPGIRGAEATGDGVRHDCAFIVEWFDACQERRVGA